MSLYESVLLPNMFRMLFHSSSVADDSIYVYCSVSVCTGVLVWFGRNRVESECKLVDYFKIVVYKLLDYCPESRPCGCAL